MGNQWRNICSPAASGVGLFKGKVRVMNMKNLGLPLVALTFLLLAGCATQTVVTLQNGTQYLTKDTPKTKTADGFYEFTDIAGKRIRVKADDVATVRKED